MYVRALRTLWRALAAARFPALACLTLLLTGCQIGERPVPGSQPPTATTTAGDPTATIYAAVIRQLAGPDDTFGGQLPKQTLYIVRATNDAAGDPTHDGSPSVILPPTIQDAITAELADLEAAVVWVDGTNDVALDPDTGWVADDGVIMQLGNIRFESPTRALVAGSIYIASLAAGGSTYVVEQQGGQWVLTGTTGARWIS
jgi:hypothetical protein